MPHISAPTRALAADRLTGCSLFAHLPALLPQVLYMPTVSTPDGALGFVQLDVSLNPDTCVRPAFRLKFRRHQLALAEYPSDACRPTTGSLAVLRIKLQANHWLVNCP